MAQTVYSKTQDFIIQRNPVPDNMELNTRLKMDGIDLLDRLPDASASACFFDPQYRGVLNHLSYGNEGMQRGQKRASMPRMSDQTIAKFISEIYRVLGERGHMFLWVDKYHLCTGIDMWIADTNFNIVDMIVWNKMRIGMGYRTRRKSEFLMVLQKPPKRAKGIWSRHDIPDVWEERVSTNITHAKPIGLHESLIDAVTSKGDLIIDPAAGSFVTLDACINTGRSFLGCDING